jgi:glutamate-5-semialdehyde dehydrogenase
MDNLIFKPAVEASRRLRDYGDTLLSLVLDDAANALIAQRDAVLEANERDLKRMSPDDPRYDRLKLTRDRLLAMSEDMKSVACLPSPLGRTLRESVRPNGMRIRKVSVPFGVVGVIYEARPNVTFDVFSLCLKSGNACILKGGSDAEASNLALTAIIRSALKGRGLPAASCILMPAGHHSTVALLQATGSVDLLIPRGSGALISYVRENARVPVIETGAGICHTYFDRDGDREKCRAIVNNAKTRRVSVCNALDCLIAHRDRLDDLSFVCAPLADSRVTIYADEPALNALRGRYPDALLLPASPESYGTEFLDYKMSIRTVASTDEAMEHIARHGSGHSECIVTESRATAFDFERKVDAACVYVNVSTAFTDGAQFGFGAELGISTQKLHARGPMALPELTTYKYLVEGEGQIRC